MRIASERSGGREGSIDEAEVPLSARLRALTSTAHRELEARTGWPETLDGAGDVATMLRMFRALHASLDAAHAGFEGSFRQHGFAPGSGSAAAMIDEDLRALGTEARPLPVIFEPCPDFDAALGLHYVAAGSAMGNLLILRHIAAHPDPSIVAASRFLKLSASRAVPAFRTFRAALDLYGGREPAQASAVASGADAAFRACVAWLDAEAVG